MATMKVGHVIKIFKVQIPSIFLTVLKKLILYVAISGNFMMATTKVGHVIKQKRQRSKVSYWDVSSIRSQLEVRYHMKTTLNDMGITTVSRNSGMVKNASRVSADVNRPYIEQVKQCRRGGDCPNFSTRIAAKNLYSENGGNDALSFMPPAASSSNTEPEVIVIDDDDDNDNDDDDNVGIADRFHVICNASDTVLHLRKDDTTGPRVKEECVLPVDGAADTSQGGAGEKSAHQTDSRKKRAKRKVTDSSSGKIKTEPDDVSPVKKTVLSAVQEGCVVYEIIDDNNMIRLRGAGKPKDARHVKKSVVSRVQEDDDEHESLDNNKVIGVCGGGKPKDVSKVQEDDDEHESLDNNNIIGVCEGGKPKDATPVKETVSSVQEDSVEHEILDDNNMIGVCGEPKDATPVKKTLSRVQEDGLENLDGKEHKKHDGNGEKSGVSYVQIDGIELENLDGKEHKEHDGNGRIDDKCAAGKSGEKSGVSNVQEDGVENENLDGDVEGEKQVGNGRIDKCVVGETGDGAPSENSGVSNSQEHGVEPENLNDDHITDIRRAGQPADDSPGKNPGVPNNQEEYVERENENRNGNTSDGCGIGVPSDDKPVVRSIAPNVQEDDVLGKNPDKNLSVYTSGVEKTGNEGVSHASPSGEVVIPVASAAETSPSDSTEVDVNVGLPYNDNALPEPVLHSSTEESK